MILPESRGAFPIRRGRDECALSHRSTRKRKLTRSEMRERERERKRERERFRSRAISGQIMADSIKSGVMERARQSGRLCQ